MPLRLTGQPKRSRTTIFILLSIAAILPLTVFMGVSLSDSLKQQRTLIENELINKARLISDDVDQELRAQVDFARAFADLPALDTPADVDYLVKFLNRAIQHEPFWLVINVFDPEEKMLFVVANEGKPPESRKVIEGQSLRRVIDTGKLSIGMLVQGPSGNWGIPIRVPVIRDGKVIYVLSIVLKAAAFNVLLATWKMPSEWNAVIADENGGIVARTRSPETTVGKSISMDALTALRSGKPNLVYIGRTIDVGDQFVASYQVSPITKWSVHVGIPIAEYYRPIVRLKLVLSIGGFVAMSLAVFFILLLIKELRRRQLELQLLGQKQRLESLGELTGRVAHDFNNLLFVIDGNAEIMEATQCSPRLAAIRSAAARATKLTNDLLNFSRGGGSKPQIIELRKHVHELIRTLEVTFPENIHITLDMDRQNSLYVAVDPVQFELAIVNLIRNACDAMPNGGLIEVIARKEEGITLMICDTGHGILSKVLPRIFDPFFTTKGDKGTGFGLSQVYGFIKSAGGTISVDSEKTGTTFTMTFPVAGPLLRAA
jgi:signal transduction histidine kinase